MTVNRKITSAQISIIDIANPEPVIRGQTSNKTENFLSQSIYKPPN